MRSETQNDIKDLGFVINEISSEYDSIDSKECPPNNIGTLYKRIISSLSSETAFLKEELFPGKNIFS